MKMKDVHVGVVGLGNVGSGTVSILAGNAAQISQKLGFDLRIGAVCSLDARERELPAGLGNVKRTTDWREVVSNPDVLIVAELIGGTTVARQVIKTAIANGKSVITANKELMALAGAEGGGRAGGAGGGRAGGAGGAGGGPGH